MLSEGIVQVNVCLVKETMNRRAFCDAACEAVICWLEVLRKTSSIRNGPKLEGFPAYLGARKHLGLTLAFREVAADFLAHR